jgi:CBS-domain-containing membrane protein
MALLLAGVALSCALLLAWRTLHPRADAVAEMGVASGATVVTGASRFALQRQWIFRTATTEPKS